MTEREFQANAQAAKTFQELTSDQPYDYSSDFWIGYQRGLRRNYHGARFGTPEEHKLWLSLADEANDEMRRMRGLGYRAGFEGQNVQAAMKTLEVK